MIATMALAPSCQAYASPPTISRAADARRASAALSLPLAPGQVDGAVSPPGCRFVWVRPAAHEPGVVIFRREGRGYRYAQTWGGVVDDRGEALAWAARQGMPSAVATCFVDQLMKVGP